MVSFLQQILSAMAIAFPFGTVLAVNMGLHKSAFAQISSDGTLSTTITSSDDRNFVIEDGDRANTNLFHSFDTFSIPNNGSAHFNNARDVTTIFSRVTGGNVSDIQGILRTNGTADLFLMNPAGIIFGENAALDIGGSFFATTAESLVFGENLYFSAVQPTNNNPLLSVNVTPGLQMGQQSEAITVNGPGHLLIGGGLNPIIDTGTVPGLQVSTGQTLGLVAGQINLNGGVLNLAGGSVQLGSLRDGIWQLGDRQASWQPDLSATQQWGDIILAEQSLVSTTGASTGDIQINGRNIQIHDASIVMIQATGIDVAGDILINATESLEVSGSRRIGPDLDALVTTIPGINQSSMVITLSGEASSGDITIDSKNMTLAENGSVSLFNFGIGDSGSITVNVANDIEIFGASSINPTFGSVLTTATFGSGKAGDINILTHNLTLADGGTLAASTFAEGLGGSLSITVKDALTIRGFIATSGVPTTLSSATFGSGNSGNTIVNVGTLAVLGGGTLSSFSAASGNAGELIINASNQVEVKDNIPNLEFFSRINSDTPVLDEALRQQLGLTEIPSGNAGNVILNTPRLRVRDGGAVSVSNQGLGDSGQLQINADQISIENGGSVTAFSRSGQGGDIDLTVKEALVLHTNSLITANTTGAFAENRDGDISETTSPRARRVPNAFRSQLRNNEEVNRTVDGGNITIISPLIIGVGNSDIVANAVEGNGGNISLTTQGLFGLEFRDRLTSDNDITASSQFGVSGTVEINEFNTEPDARLVELPIGLVDSSGQITKGCASNSGNRFISTGRGGIPINPTGLMQSDRPWTDNRDLSTFLEHDWENRAGEDLREDAEGDRAASATSELNTPTALTEATAWQVNRDGHIELRATHQENTPPAAYSTCTVAS